MSLCPRERSRRDSRVSRLLYLGFLGGLPLIGSLAQLSTLRVACTLLAIAGVVVVVLAPSTREPRPGGSAARSPVAL